MKKVIYYLIFILILACNKEDKISGEIILEVKSLDTNNKKVAFYQRYMNKIKKFVRIFPR